MTCLYPTPFGLFPSYSHSQFSFRCAMWLTLVERFAAKLFHLTLCFFGVRWNARYHRLQLVQLCFWILWYIVIWSFAVHRTTKVSYCSFDCLITHAMFFMLSICHVFILLDTFVHHGAYHNLGAQTQVALQDVEELQQRRHHVSLVLCSVLVPNIAMQCVVAWCRLRMDRMWNMSFFWVVFPASVGIQLKLYSFFWDILRANVRIVNLREHLKQLARKAKNHWKLPAPDTRSVLRLKQSYSRLTVHFAQINLCYGNSLLIIFLHYFFNFTFNAYWMVKNLLVHPANTIMIIFHSGILFNLGLLFTVICWHCQQSYNHVSTVSLPQIILLTSFRYRVVKSAVWSPSW